MPAIIVRAPKPDDRTDWTRIWSANCAHFGASMTEAHDRDLWRRIMNLDHPVCALVCSPSDHEGTLLGLAHYVLHPHTFSNKMVCYLEDSWVEPSARRAGIGRAFVGALVALGKEQDWRRIYWHTETDNVTARSLCKSHQLRPLRYRPAVTWRDQDVDSEFLCDGRIGRSHNGTWTCFRIRPLVPSEEDKFSARD